MKIYDKASWHIDAGENKSDVVERFTMIFEYLYTNNMLNDNGKELLEIGIDSEITLHDELLTANGIEFLDENYDSISELSNETLKGCLLDESES